MGSVLGRTQYGKAEVRLSNLRATDTQKNTVYAFARDGVGEPEDFTLRLGTHFVTSSPAITGARIAIDQSAWDRIVVDGAEHHHAFAKAGSQRRTTVVTLDGNDSWVVSGLADLVVLKSTGSEFWGFPRDAYTTLAGAQVLREESPAPGHAGDSVPGFV